jgi:aldehyde:ferredoxin oxidoreductase
MSELYGYNGKLAFINLTSKEIVIKDLNSEDAKNYLGGCGLSAKIAYDLLKEEDYKILQENPLAEINPLIFATGPITATSRPSSGRYSVSIISPLTGIWGEATSGGQFPASLKKCGFDAIIITGRANTPVYIYVNNGEIEIKNADHLWGHDTYETQNKIKEEIEDKRLRIACIGKAGENLVKYACIINDDGRAAGRTGVGAVMGSKNCKAIAIVGTQQIALKDKEEIKNLTNDASRAVRRSFTISFLGLFGTLAYMDLGQVFGDIPSFYFTSTEFLSTHLTGKALREKYPVVSSSCFGCTIGCGRTTFLESDGEEIRIDGPEYETTATFGPLCGVTDIESVLLMNHLSNQQGIDTISAGVSIAFLIYLVENGIAIENIKNLLKDINIEDIKWGNSKIIQKILSKIINREGIGDLIAEGTRIMAQKLDVDPGLAAQVKGLEIPMHDPRAYVAQGLCYMTNCIGASHTKGDIFSVDGEGASFPSLKIKSRDRFTVKRKERSIKNLQDVRAIDDSAISCMFIDLPFPLTVQYFNAITGFDYTKESLLKCGERITNLKRLISCNLGLSRKNDYLPKIITQPLNMGPTKGIALDLEENLKTYYKLRKWDWETGCPTQEKLEELGI